MSAFRATSRRAASKSRRGLLAAHLNIDSADHRRLGLERLEDRRMLAVFTVSNLSDSGAGSLRDAIATANSTAGLDTIDFDPTVFTGGAASVIRTGGLVIEETLVIDGSTATDVTITGDTAGDDVVDANFITDVAASGETRLDDNAFRGVIRFSAVTGDLTINDVTVTGGRNLLEVGGGIYFHSEGALTLTNTTVSGNSTTSLRGAGGGIYVDGGILTVINSTVSGNSTAGYLAEGGGIVAGHVFLTNSTVSGNSTAGDDSNGGGIDALSVTLTDSVVSGNRTTGDDSAGGGIYAVDVSLTNSIVAGNHTAGSSAAGGGIYSFNGVNVISSTVSGNSTAGDDAAGGGIFADYVYLTSSTVSGNFTTGSSAHGGGIYTPDSSNFSYDSDVTLKDSTLSGNSTAALDANGGGIFTNGAGTFSTGDVKLVDSTVTGNSAGGVGGGVYVLDNSNSDRFALENTILAGNTDNGVAADLFADPDSALAVNYSLIGDTSGGLTATQLLDISAGSSNLTDLNPLLGPLADNGGPTQTHALLPNSPAIDAGNSAETTDQRGEVRPIDQLLANAAGGNGSDIGAFEFQNLALVVTTAEDELDIADTMLETLVPGDLSLREAIAIANTIEGTDGISFDSTVFTGGLASLIRLTLGELEITESLVVDAQSVGGVTITGDASGNDVLVANTFVTDIDASLADDAMSLDDNSRVLNFAVTSGELTLNGLTITGGRNTNLSGGGGIRTTGGNLTLARSKVTGNNASVRGGGIYAFSASVALTESTVEGNRGILGGGIYTQSGDVTVIESTISGNRADSGGGVSTGSGVITLESSTVSGNTATSSGAGINTSSGTVLLSSSTITENVAGGDGGGIRVSQSAINPSLTIINSIVAGNLRNTSQPNDLVPDSDGMLTVVNSLIGINTSVNLTGGTPNADGNFVGTIPDGAVDPMLGPLADNGGPTQTHALLPGSPAIDAFDATPLLDYQLNGSFADAQGGADLVDFGGQLTGSAYVFEPNEGLEAQLPAANSADYSIELSFRLDELTGDQKIVDFSAPGFPDAGLYASGNRLRYIMETSNPVNVFTRGPFLETGQDYHLVIARSSGADADFKFFLDGVELASLVTSFNLTFGDGTTGQHELGVLPQAEGVSVVRLFRSSNVFGVPGAGAVDFLRVYDRRLSSSDVVLTIDGLPETDQRGLARPSGAGADIGAFELQATPAGDFDADGDVDGFDFLTWQRGFGSAFDAGDLVVWQDAYGASPPAAINGQAATIGTAPAEVELIDAAMAYELLTSAESEQSSPVVDQPNVESVLADPIFVEDLAVETNHVEAVRAEDSFADDAESLDQPWIAEELLEKVFV